MKSSMGGYAQWILGSAVAVLMVCTISLSILITERQQSLARTSRYELTWSASQATNELARFGQEVAAYSVAPSVRAKRAVVERFEVLQSRASIFQSGEFRAFADADPDRQSVVTAFSQALDRLEPLVANIATPGYPAQIIVILGPVIGRLAFLSSSANNYSAVLVEQDRQNLLCLHRIFSGLTLCLILTGFALIWVLKQQFGRVKEAHGRLSAQNELFDAALTNMSQGLCMFDRDGRLIVSNQRLSEVLELDPLLLAKGFHLDEVNASDRHHVLKLSAPSLHPIPEASGAKSSLLLETKDNRVVSVLRNLLPGGGWLATFEDVTGRRRDEERVAYLASHDELTGLPNRARFQAALREALDHNFEEKAGVALLCLDLDRFKAVNDTLGHPVGDLLLKSVAKRLYSCLHQGDIVARLGGDEFSIIQRHLTSPNDAGALAARVIEALQAPFDLDGHQVLIDVSIGISVAPNDGGYGDRLLKNADLALYQAKSEGRGTFKFFELTMEIDLQARRDLEMDLRRAIERREFELFFQPIVDLRNPAKATCYETLLRWRHPERGMVLPGDFIPLAEEIGLIVPLGVWILHEACRQASLWANSTRVAVNLSSVQFKRDDVVALAKSALASSGLPASRLEIEITESVLMENGQRTKMVLSELRALGISIVMDDFGTGYSSLSYLSNFVFSKIKIDRSFVKDMDLPRNRGIVNAIIFLGQSLGMTVTAEGIETPEQAGQLIAAGCDEGQGYYFSQPKPGADFPELVSRAEHSQLQAVA
jgi:diguanylate cyclase (GGDEF)-like protein